MDRTFLVPAFKMNYIFGKNKNSYSTFAFFRKITELPSEELQKSIRLTDYLVIGLFQILY